MYKKDLESITEAVVVVKNFGPSVSHKELHNFFSQVANVRMVKIAINKKGESLGYGCVYFERSEDADLACRKMNGSKLKENELVIERVLLRIEKEKNSNNHLYVKHLPEGKSKEEIEKILSVNLIVK